MKLTIGSDHAAFAAKEELKSFLTSQGHEVEDLGTHGSESCDYPDFAAAVARKVGASDEGRGILVCGTGIGMSIAANKLPGIRAALCHDPATAEMSRAHNNANILCLGARILPLEKLLEITRVWLEAPFEGGRHALRLAKIQKLEEKPTL